MDAILNMLSICGNPYLALSFGKDSLVTYDLIRQVYPTIQCIFLKSEETYMLYDYEKVMDYYLNEGLKLHIVETNRLSENNWDWEKARKAGNKDFNLFQFEEFDGIFMGLRIEESKQRKYSITRKINQVYPMIHRYSTGIRDGMHRCCPVAHWNKDEIMLYLKSRNLPFLDVYNNGAFIRTTARLTGDAVRSNALFWIKKSNPERYNQIISKLPELKKFE